MTDGGPVRAGRVTHPRIRPRRGAARASTWWGKAWVRAAEESAYGDGDLKAARSLARAGSVGAITVTTGRYLAADEAGVELLPFGGELEASCTCSAWVDPCAHALAAAYQVAWLVDADPFVLLALRGLSREDLLGRLHNREERRSEVPDDPDDVALAVDAATRATRILQLLDAGDLDVEHLL